MASQNILMNLYGNLSFPLYLPNITLIFLTVYMPIVSINHMLFSHGSTEIYQ